MSISPEPWTAGGILADAIAREAPEHASHGVSKAHIDALRPIVWALCSCGEPFEFQVDDLLAMIEAKR